MTKQLKRPPAIKRRMCSVGTPGRTRTCGPRFRKPLLYPAELQAHFPVHHKRYFTRNKRKKRLDFVDGSRLGRSDPVLAEYPLDVSNNSVDIRL